MVRTARLLTCAFVFAVVADGVQAGVFQDVVRGLRLAQFQFEGSRNPLSDGASFSLTRAFRDETLDFGATELTLTGPIQFTFETGGRFLPVLDVSINTVEQPFNYTLRTDVGGQATTVEGNFLLDATGSINAFGFYDFQFRYSVRETITQEGRFGNDEEFVEFDIGPIDVSGNIFADMLAVLFDPFFESAGTPNLFASFSGRLQAEEELNRRVAAARAKALPGANPTAAEVPGGMRSTVPEPPTLLLLAVVIPFLRNRRR